MSKNRIVEPENPNNKYKGLLKKIIKNRNKKEELRLLVPQFCIYYYKHSLMFCLLL